MDSRTRKRHEARFQALAHLIAGHHGVLQGEDYAEILREGISAALTLGLPLVARQQARRINRASSDAVRVALEVYAGTVEVGQVERTDADEPISVPSCWPVEGEQWGIGRGLPTGDVL